jgi:hypothetical protein
LVNISLEQLTACGVKKLHARRLKSDPVVFLDAQQVLVSWLERIIVRATARGPRSCRFASRLLLPFFLKHTQAAQEEHGLDDASESQSPHKAPHDHELSDKLEALLTQARHHIRQVLQFEALVC